MNAVVNQITNLVADERVRWADQAGRLAVLEQQMGSAVKSLQTIAATAEQTKAVVDGVAASVSWWYWIQLLTLLCAPAAASALWTFIRRKDSVVLKVLGGAVACLMSPISTGFMLVGSVMLRSYRSCCRSRDVEAPADPPGPAEPRARAALFPYGGCGGYWSEGSSEFADVDRRGVAGFSTAGVPV